jgi:hypothetical protein
MLSVVLLVFVAGHLLRFNLLVHLNNGKRLSIPALCSCPLFSSLDFFASINNLTSQFTIKQI